VDERFLVPPDVEAGVYATTALVWHTRSEFTIDFAAPLGPERAEVLAADVLVVARVRIPTAFAFDLLRMLSGMMERYEREWGEIRVPERRGEDGEEE
jgi:hypothetical protein